MNKMAMIRRLSTRHPNFGLLNFRFGLGICQWTLFFRSSLTFWENEQFQLL